MHLIRSNRIVAAALAVVTTVALHGATIELWSGTETANWDNGLQISTSAASGKCSAGDVLYVEFNGSGWFKINRWNPWKNIYEGESGSEHFSLTLTSSNINDIIGTTLQLQGQGLTFRRVSVRTDGEGGGETPTPTPTPDPSYDFMNLDDAIYSGASRNGTQVKFEPQGAMGWYWQGGKNLTGCNSIAVDFGNGAPADFVMQVFYHDALDTASARISKGTRTFNFNFADKGVDPKDVYSVNLVSRSGNEATATFNSFVGLDASGQQWKPQSSEVTAIEEMQVADVVSVEYFNLQGIRINCPAEGLVIKRVTYSNGNVRTEKVLIGGNE